ncbi:MAG TPA: alkaline phosphatase family protein [Polyangia bacterium]|nr:alkaline phosphatase family protein [Polyangia bacterium]
MLPTTPLRTFVSALTLGALSFAPAGAQARNVIIFVADGLRPGAVNATDAPTLLRVRGKGVFFANSHAVYPSLTMPNGSALATGHWPGDTGVFGNWLAPGFPSFDKGSFTGVAPRSAVPFVEDDQVLGDLNTHFSGANFLGYPSLLDVARGKGIQTAAIGKLGPTVLQDISEATPKGGASVAPATVVLDDRTGDPAGLPLAPGIAEALAAAGLPAKAPNRCNTGAAPKSPGDNGFPGSCLIPGTTAANISQQQYFADALTKAVLPRFAAAKKPFLVVFWSRDPDGTQHNQGDSLNALTPGINGPTTKLAVRNVDGNLKQILDFVEADPGLAADTDVFVTADHGFSTISRHDVDRDGKATTSASAKFTYKDPDGKADVQPGFVPPGFVAIDLAIHLKLPLFDPDTQVAGEGGVKVYAPVDWTAEKATATRPMRPKLGNGLIGGTGAIQAPGDARVVVGANGGSDLIYVAQNDPALVRELAAFLLQQDYVGALFTSDAAGKIPGALPLSAVGLAGSAQTPAPSLVVAFRTFATDAADPENTAVEIADATQQQGQGMHGSFGRGDMWNNMAAIGPDFKAGFVDRAPAGNADVPVTVAKILGLPFPAKGGKLTGRVLTEALAKKPGAPAVRCGVLASAPDNAGLKTWLHYQEIAGARYLDAALRTSAASGADWGAWTRTLPCSDAKKSAPANAGR